ncbi:MAG: hypothetical protein AAGG08_04005, partial [Actinomycetota bacterium]
ADERAERTSLPESPRRPQVYLAYTGTQALAGANDAQWSFVRANLDGWWGNVVGMSLDQVVAVTRKVATRDLVVENDIAPGGACSPFVGGTVTFFDRVESVAPDLEFERLAGALYAGSNPNCWGASGGITTAQQQYAAQGYPAVWSLYQPQNLSSTVNAGAFPTIAAGSSGDVALRNSDAVVLECPVDACTDPTFGAPFWNALLEAHARDVPFVWYTANSRLYGINSGWLGRIQRTYNAAAAFGLWRPEDVIVIVHNTAAGSYPMLPETNADGTSADTTTGILHWLLTQTPITTLCTDSVAC